MIRSQPPSAPGQPPAPPLPSWRRDPPARWDPPEGAEYGYVLADGPHPCTREELLEWVRTYPGTPAVWTPETAGTVRPEEVPFLVEGLRSRREEEAQQRLGLAALAVLGVAGAFVLLPIVPSPTSSPGALLLAALAGFWLLDSIYALRRAKRVDAGTFAQQRQNERHAAWAYSRPAPLTRLLAGALGAVFLAEGFAYERAVAAAGLVKEAVWAGEAWRLLTGPMLHGGLLHLGMNLAALLVLGRFVEAHAPRWRLPLVFLVAALAGSVLSLLLSPAASVGASGGILGLVGFLGVRAGRRPAEFPDDFLHRIRYAVGATAVLGLLGFAFVDNWAHLGGLLGGAALGWLPDDGPEGKRAWTAAAGRAALAVVVAACAWAAARMLGLA
ncbi:MAG TPA: rhomboid family intramembrane serine protease [Longimicrobiaceae bacterium]|nr:rhomboid family intramembrane serine protease [Longimicrobiaceae bacterium]